MGALRRPSVCVSVVGGGLLFGGGGALGWLLPEKLRPAQLLGCSSLMPRGCSQSLLPEMLQEQQQTAQLGLTQWVLLC